jgi:aminopeptidase N
LFFDKGSAHRHYILILRRIIVLTIPTAPQPIQLAHYKPTPYSIETVSLDISLEPGITLVRSRLHLKPNPSSGETGAALVLDGEKIALQRIALNGLQLSSDQYRVTEQSLTIPKVPQEPFSLDIETTCDPQANTELSGLYISNGIFCTQCEAEGFRRITYYLDRPDVMARFMVRLEADRQQYPVLLSNGNPSTHGPVGDGARHFMVWDDPFPKPSYLFALVAGNLGSVRDAFTTASGRKVELNIYVEKGKEDRCAWAMESLKASMRWDETRFGREYDLDVFNIVAVSDFNMGAMENKGLNIFNDKYILALPTTATDLDYSHIERIVAHEYFHNWTGNRVTCRDWFQLCLKEGLTVFRDQEFSSDMRSRSVKRINDVKTLRARQFPEDGGPLAHPVRPTSYIEINNFYTPTVYEKGAEICRMMQTLIGNDAFRKGMDLFFIRHDGEAARVEDLVSCMADASGRDLTQFFRWYEQAGTPRVLAETNYDPVSKVYTLTLEQHTPATPGQDNKLPLHIPLGIGIVGPDGEDMPLDLKDRGVLNTPLLELTETRQVFHFRNVARRPVLSLNRGFSAPVQLAVNTPAEDQLFLMKHDRDSFNRWEAGQMRARSLILQQHAGNGREDDLADYANALRSVLEDESLDGEFKALMLGLPTEGEIAAIIGKDVDTDAVHAARDQVRLELGTALKPVLSRIWQQTEDRGPYSTDQKAMARRSLRYSALALLIFGDRSNAISAAMAEFEQASHMTAETGVLGALVQIECPEREAALDLFHARHRKDPLLLDKWLLFNALCAGDGAAGRVTRLTDHPDFSWTTPNRVYALIAGFTAGNSAGFNTASGEGYRAVADAIIRLNDINPQVAARLATGFRSCRVPDANRRGAAEAALDRVLQQPKLSRDVFEIVSRIRRG